MSQPYDALLVVSFGGPDGPDDVLPFLENVLRGRNVPRERMLEVVSGTGVWYRAGSVILPVRWVLTRDPSGTYPPKAYFTTDPEEEAIEVVHSFIKRWTIEVTFEERRAERIWE